MAQEIKKVRNGELDFFKFIFAIVIFLYHCRSFATPTDTIILRNGSYAVEFFFIVSGFFFIPSVQRYAKKQNSDGTLTLFQENVGFLGNKIKGILGIYIISVVFSLIIYTIEFTTTHDSFQFSAFIFSLCAAIWNILLLQSVVTAQVNLNSATWYMSAMFIIMFILYPCVRKNKDFYVKYLCPIGALICISLLIDKKYLSGVDEPTTFLITMGVVRAFMGIMLGSILYEFTEYIKARKITFTLFSRICITLMGFLAFAYSLVIMHFSNKEILGDKYNWKVNFTVIISLAIFVFVVNSGLDITKNIFNNSFCGFLGNLSTAFYMLHIPCRRIVQLGFENCTYIQKVSIMFAFSLFASLIAIGIVNLCKKKSLSANFKKIFIK